MDNTVNLISTSLSVPNLWGIVGFIIPILTISVLFGLGFHLIKKITHSFVIPTAGSFGGRSDDDVDKMVDEYNKEYEYYNKKYSSDFDDDNY